MNENDEKLIRIQKSTRTTLPFFVPIHNFLRMRLKWYYNWHLWKHSSRTHVAVLVATILGIVGGMWFSINGVVNPKSINAAGESWLISNAGDESYNGLYADAGVHNAKSYYQLDATHILYYDDSDYPNPGPYQGWLLGSAFGNAAYMGDNSLTPDLCLWSATSGTPPAPTVAAGSVTVPDPPTIGTATGGNAQASVTFTPPGDDGGSAITGYTVTSIPSSITGTGASSPIVVSGLTNGTSYTFTVHATNAVGDSAESAASNAVVPAASGITVSGTVYTDIQKSSNIGANKTIALSINGAAATTAETVSDGSYSFSGLTIPENAVVAMFISGETEKGSIIIQTGTVVTTYTGLEWYKDNVKPSFRVGTDITEITNAALDTADNVGDSDLGVTVSGSTATFANNMILYVWDGKTYRPNGNVVAGDVVVHGTMNTEANTITVSGDFIKGGNYYYSTGTLNLIGDGVVQAINGESLSFYDLSMAASLKTTQMLSSLEVEHMLTLGVGNLTGDSSTSIWFSRNDGGSPLVNNGATINIHRFFFSPFSGSITVPGGNYGTVEYVELYARGSNVAFNISGDITVNGRVLIVGYNTTSGMVVNTNNYVINAVGMVWGYENAYGNTTTNFGSSVVNLGSYGIAPLPAPGGSHVVNFNSATLNVGGSFDLLDITPNFGTSVLNMIATTSGKNIKTYGNNLSNGITFNGVGGEWTLQDDLNALNLSVTNGKLIDNGKNVDVGGNISIDSSAKRLDSTGDWTLTNNGSVDNNFLLESANNSFKSFTVNSGVSAQVDTWLSAQKLLLLDGSSLIGSGRTRIAYPVENDPFLIHQNSTFSNILVISLDENSTIHQQSINLPSVTAMITPAWKAGTGTLIMDGNFSLASMQIYSAPACQSEVCAETLDTNGHNLILAGDLSFGAETSAGRYGKVLFRTGSHIIGGNIFINDFNGVFSRGYLDLASANISVLGNIDLTSAIVAPGTGNIYLTGTSAGKTIVSGGQTLPNLFFDGVGGEWTLQDDLTVSSLTITNGKLIDNGQTVNVAGDISVANKADCLVSTGVWALTANGNISNQYYQGPAIDPNNRINEFRIANSVTATKTVDFFTSKLVLGDNSLLTGSGQLRMASVLGDNFLVQSATSDIQGGAVNVYNRDRISLVQNGAIHISANLIINQFAGGDTLRMTGSISTPYLWVMGSVSSTDVTTAAVLDMNGNSITADTVKLGNDFSTGNGWRAKIILGSGSNAIGTFYSAAGTSFTQGYLNIGSATISVNGDLHLNNINVTPGTGKIILNSTATGKTILTAGQIMPNVEFNGAGGEWTLQDDLLVFGLTVTNGKLIDNAKMVTVNGDILIADVPHLLMSTGIWIQSTSGNLSDPEYTNDFAELRISDNITSTRSGVSRAKKLVLGLNSVLTGSQTFIIQATADDPLVMGEGSNIQSGKIIFRPPASQTITQSSLDIPVVVYVNIGYGSTFKITGDWNVKALQIYGLSLSTSESTAQVFDTNGYNLATTGDLMLAYNGTVLGDDGLITGSDPVIVNGYQGKILFKNGSHSVGGSLSASPSVSGSTSSKAYFDFGSSHLSVGGNFTLDSNTEIVGNNTSTIILNGNVAQSVTSVLPFYNLTVANISTEGASLVGDIRVNNTFTDTTPSSKITFGSGQNYDFANININGGSLSTPITMASSTPGSQWKFNVSNSWPTVSYVSASDSNASGGSQVRATDGTSRDSGNNVNWLFSRAISRVILTPHTININPGLNNQFTAKIYNVWDEEVIGAVTWSVNPSAGTVSNSGLFTASSNIGSFDNAVTATIDGFSASADVSILAVQPYVVPGWIIISPDSKILKPEEEYQFSGKVYDTIGVEITNAEPTWELASGGGEMSESGFFKAGKDDGVFVNSVVAKYADVRSYATVVVRGDQAINSEKDKTFISAIISAGKATLEAAKMIAQNDLVKEVALVLTIMATASAGISGLFGLASAQMGMKEWLYFIVNYFLSLRAARRKNKFGMVFDESSQRPVAGAMISLFDFKTMRLVSTAITDKNGAYIFLVQPGEYVMSVTKPGYLFPSNMIRMSQNLVNNYIGQTLAVTNENPVVNQNIPLDPSNNQQIKIGLFYRLMNSIYFRPVTLLIGSLMTVYSLLIQPKILNYIIAAGFVLLWFAELFIQNRNVKFCKVVDNVSHKPVPLALVRIMSPENKLIETFISDQYGRVLPKSSNIGDIISVEKSGYSKISQVISSQGLVERKKFGLIKGES